MWHDAAVESTVIVRLWHAVVALVVLAALIAQVGVTINEDRSLINMFSYFTIQSNILVVVASAVVAADPRRDGTVFQAVRLAGLVGITVTGLVYQAVLVGNLEMEGIEVVLDNVFHRFAPLAAVAGFLGLRPRTPLTTASWWFLAWAFGWLGYTLARAELANPVFTISDTQTAPVPYGFLDIETEGGWSVTVACAVVLLIAIVIGSFYRWVATSRPRRSTTTSNT